MYKEADSLDYWEIKMISSNLNLLIIYNKSLRNNKFYLEIYI